MSVWCSILTFTDDEPIRAPLIYRESHVIPTAQDPRGGELSLATLPGFLTRDGRDDADSDAWWPYLRVSLRSPKPGEDHRGARPGPVGRADRRPRRPARLSQRGADVTDERCMLVCRKCDPTGDRPIPFADRTARGRWAALHTKGTGHADWYCVDGWPNSPEVEEMLAAHDRQARELLDLVRKAKL